LKSTGSDYPWVEYSFPADRTCDRGMSPSATAAARAAVILTDIARRRSGRLDIGAGVAYVFDNIDWSSMALQTMIRYRDFWGQVWGDGIPVGGIQNIEFGTAC